MVVCLPKHNGCPHPKVKKHVEKTVRQALALTSLLSFWGPRCQHGLQDWEITKLGKIQRNSVSFRNLLCVERKITVSQKQPALAGLAKTADPFKQDIHIHSLIFSALSSHLASNLVWP